MGPRAGWSAIDESGPSRQLRTVSVLGEMARVPSSTDVRIGQPTGLTGVTFSRSCFRSGPSPMVRTPGSTSGRSARVSSSKAPVRTVTSCGARTST